MKFGLDLIYLILFGLVFEDFGLEFEEVVIVVRLLLRVVLERGVVEWLGEVVLGLFIILVVDVVD